MKQKWLCVFMLLILLLTACSGNGPDERATDNLFTYAVDISGEDYSPKAAEFLITLEDYLKQTKTDSGEVVDESPSQTIYRTIKIKDIPVEITEKIEFQYGMCVMVTYYMSVESADWPKVSEVIVSQAKAVMPEPVIGSYEELQSVTGAAGVYWADYNDESRNTLGLQVVGPEMTKKEMYMITLKLGVAKEAGREAAGVTKPGLGQ